MDAVIDTNALVYDYVEDSEFHKEAAEALDRAEGWAVPSVVIEEFVFVMKRARLDDAILQHKIGELLDDRRVVFVPVGAKDVKDAVRLLSSEKGSLSRLNDKLVLSVARRKKMPLLTFDKGLQAQCKRFGVKVMPDLL